ncbi:MAG TPA: alpha-amylase family glycosyl hydrolase [Candidatus Limnocylindrales bacterium]|nr:alpha-amylase family glycosyl hydrolase [Candidatus Limnocylindrales bacterium]
MTRSGVASVARSPRFGDDWWRRGVIYQIYPRSFADTDGDGVGDLRGIVDHLDHLGPDGLGVDAIWLSPIYPSPGRDVGYDVSDHRHVDPVFGSEHDFDALVAEAHRRSIRVVLDLVMNHTSDRHPWFVASRASRTGPYADWYIWRDPSGIAPDGTPIPPNNWVSWFGGPAWTYEPARGQFYHHTFLAEQPELDWRTPGVEAAQFEMVQGWLDRGVDGFRLDTFNIFLKHPEMLANPTRSGTSAWTRQDHRYDIDQPDQPALIARFREIVDLAPGRMSVGEMFVGTTEGAAALTTDRHLVFDWELLTQPWRADAFRAAILRRERAFGPDRWPTIVLSNHDQSRHISRLAASIDATDDEHDAVAKAAATIELTMRGTPFLYYGEEIGMGDVRIPPEESIDPPAARVDADFQWWDRSQSRTPLPWSGGKGAGFTTGWPWLRLGDDADTRNVAAQRADPDSVLACYRRLLAARSRQPSLQDGALDLVDVGDPTVLAYRRRGSGDEVLVLVAFDRRGASVRVPPPRLRGTWRPIVGTHRELPAGVGSASPHRLRPFEGLVLVAEG